MTTTTQAQTTRAGMALDLAYGVRPAETCACGRRLPAAETPVFELETADGKTILDGRNRLAACKRAGVEPEFATYEGDDPDGYALSVNIQRRNLTKGQQAMIAVKGAAISEKSQRSISADHGVSQSRL